jgi:alanyl-tRNA synthetase
MNQFKDVFLGKSLREYTRATTAQTCIRVGGKHNDLENVGHTTRHLTFFEMLGNFSFGEYFKREAIAYAWEVTMQVFAFPPEKVWATVFETDDESYDVWRAYLPAKRIVRMGAKDNFWAMGEQGPCGPCSELYYDRGSEFSSANSPAADAGGERYLEFWNLVFMEFDRENEETLHSLPKKSVDTGAGLERIASLSQGVDSLFETDILRELIAQVEQVSRVAYHPTEHTSASFRVIADHIRTLSFAMGDGILPSNTERGYVLRKVLRRAVRYGKQLGIERPFLATILPRLIDLMGEDYPQLQQKQQEIGEVLTREEENFARTLQRGGNILHQIIQSSQQAGKLSGDDAFKLKDTYGLPLEEILLLAKDLHLPIDVARYEALEQEARDRSRGTRKTTAQHAQSSSLYEDLLHKQGATRFTGFTQERGEGMLIGIVREGASVSSLHTGEEGIIFLDQTPFYPQKGGQVGDKGNLAGSRGEMEVGDCQTPFTDLIAHIGRVTRGELQVGDRVTATIDATYRHLIANNHTATHLLHWALRTVLGSHIKQAGSVVEDLRLRFDFMHHQPLTSEEICRIEDLVNAKIRENRQVHTYEIPYTEAQHRSDIVQCFSEKYGSLVRVVDIDYAKELCGGTHTSAVGTIGLFRIKSEGSIAAGVRRIEAVTGEAALQWSRREKEELLQERRQVEEERKQLAHELSALRTRLLSLEADKLLLHHSIPVGSISLLAYTLTLEPDAVKECADLIMARVPSSLVLLLIGRQEEKCTIIVRVSPDVIRQGVRANVLLQEVTSLLGGKGGGKEDAAQGGGATGIENITNALQHARAWLEQKIS